MDKKQLEQSLSQSLEDFRLQITSNYEDGDKETAAKEDISELARQTFYVLSNFKDSILKYLDD